MFIFRGCSIEHLKVQEKARTWCKIPYEDHPKGCSNFYKNKVDCPDQAPMLFEYFDLNKDVAFLINQFDIAAWAAERLKKYPKLSTKDARNPRLWQAHQRKLIREQLPNYVKVGGFDTWTDRPEAMGLNVIVTLRRLKIPITPRPKGTIYLVAMLGHRRKNGLPKDILDKAWKLADINNKRAHLLNFSNHALEEFTDEEEDD